MKTIIQRIASVLKYILFFFRVIVTLGKRRIEDKAERNSDEEE